MTRNSKVLWLTAAAAALAATGVRAQDVTVKAAIPFAFQAADQQLPAGEYRFVTRAASGLLLVHEVKGGAPVAALVCRQLPAGTGEPGRLSFDHHDGQHFLKSIRAADGSGVSLPKTRSERQAEARAEAAAQARVAAQPVIGPPTKTAKP